MTHPPPSISHSNKTDRLHHRPKHGRAHAVHPSRGGDREGARRRVRRRQAGRQGGRRRKRTGGCRRHQPGAGVSLRRRRDDVDQLGRVPRDQTDTDGQLHRPGRDVHRQHAPSRVRHLKIRGLPLHPEKFQESRGQGEIRRGVSSVAKGEQRQVRRNDDRARAHARRWVRCLAVLRELRGRAPRGAHRLSHVRRRGCVFVGSRVWDGAD
mmetsp:Transcript_9748/g.42488  ORF Transcript_9748/g.42488 Transcript_9748/m.42488 type:complete len:209 (+) Transcript_9748:231-857(+)